MNQATHIITKTIIDEDTPAHKSLGKLVNEGDQVFVDEFGEVTMIYVLSGEHEGNYFGLKPDELKYLKKIQ